MSWRKCTRARCPAFGVKQDYLVVECSGCNQPMRGAIIDPDADVDETLLLRSRERLVKELARIDEQLAELALLKR